MPRKPKETKSNIDITEGKADSSKIASSEVKKAKKTTEKKQTSKNKTSVKSTTSKKSSNTKKTSSASKNATKKKNTTTKKSTKKVKKRNINAKKAVSFNLYKSHDFEPIVLEYYDLPYSYNKTVVKALAQNPTTLFVYWEVSDEDKENFIRQYGEKFFYLTKPVLIVHNLTDKYSYEIDINDFANNWYIHVNDSKCQYVVELGRRPIEYTEEVPTDYIYVTSSNVIDSPNDHVLFYDNNQEIYFKNIHTNKFTKKVINTFLKHVYGIYKNFNLSEDINSFDLKNPSSQNPTSNVL